MEDDEHDYEALPVGHGWATNMAAGAMAGISEHAAIFPVDSIKVGILQDVDCRVLGVEV
jgi:solute carrier family 25 iron transporter 28/37